MIADLSLLAARALVASVFVVSAIPKLKGAPDEAKAVASLHIPAPRAMERLAGGCEVIGATALIAGAWARPAAVLLALFMAAITLMFLRFWSTKAPAAVQAQQSAFFSNLATIGALLYIATVGPGAMAILPAT